ncbi:transmembrane protein 97 [Limosa lapponica baueri]|uniref:Transmembrane protein 97 n=1 Tax=Limosa lapponica baueri TaxID=1758121 RepID=A0A2I0U3U3_LIMLA|nr:transmembrane protein 97 [Limosa lapponica baueri]
MAQAAEPPWASEWFVEGIARGPWARLLHKQEKNKMSFGHLPSRVSPGGRGAGTAQSADIGTDAYLKSWVQACSSECYFHLKATAFCLFQYLFAFRSGTGGCKWIRTPAIIYSTHVATTLFAILAHILFHDFSKSQHPGPQTQRERLVLLSIYAPYLLIPLLLLFTMLFHPHYNQAEKRKRK